MTVARAVSPPRQAPPAAADADSAATGAARLWSRFVNLDWARPWPGGLLAIVYVLSRLPWVGLGYGSDPDAWRVAMSARYLVQHASYLPSRLPGYPVHDIAMAGLIWGGWMLTNLATVAVSLAGVFCFAAILRRHRIACSGVLTLTFAFMPLLWFTSTQTLDYSWALTFLLAAYLALISDKVVVAGLLLGLAGGCRVTYLVFALPFALLLWQRAALAPLLRFLGATVLTWVAVFSPVWVRYGPAFWNFYDVRPSWGDFLHALTEGSLGLMPLVVIAVCLCLSWRTLLRLPSMLRRDPQMAAWALMVVLTLFIFVRLPLQTYYLMPAAPFALLLLARLLRPAVLTILCAAIVAGGFVDIYTTSPAGWRSPAALAQIRPTAGIVLLDYRLRADRLALVEQIRGLPLPPHSVMTAGFYLPMVAELYHNDLSLTLPDGYLRQIGPLTDNARLTGPNDVVYVWLLSPGDARSLLLQGYEVYSLSFSRQSGRPEPIRVYLPEDERFGLH